MDRRTPICRRAFGLALVVVLPGLSASIPALDMMVGDTVTLALQETPGAQPPAFSRDHLSGAPITLQTPPCEGTRTLPPPRRVLVWHRDVGPIDETRLNDNSRSGLLGHGSVLWDGWS